MDRTMTGVRIDRAQVDAARERAGLPPETDHSAVIRYAVALLAGADVSAALFSRNGRPPRQSRSAA